MADHLDLGAEGERMAEAFLRKRGYEILARNRETLHKELDIVAKDGKCLVFVEVKTRQDLDEGDPLEAVTPAKQRALARAAMGYLAEHPELPDLDTRFDVIGIDFHTGDGEPQIEHVVEAFYVDH
jgi:putative endonuclease